ncbi:hypothetical protein I2I11_16395 [Pontibacter sp. 172403-2]|uniref:hypothetical protein n=1 Tax=Pontibacter rufus TaxID=2791028 RepID=UPI0018AF705D|nr:hypothetical protein [Pontibacter sp. 172403-2]MBF9254884.1 hypothetical protein [Pontibacter sp. 172403-2]
MNTVLLQMQQQLVDSGYKSKNLGSSLSKKATPTEEEKAAFSTIDGSVITFNAGKNAVSNGAGIFIGDYFVGVADHFLSISNTPFVRY